MTKQPHAIPLRPDYSRAAAPNYLFRAAYVAARAKAARRSTGELFARLYPDDDVSPSVLTRSAVSPGTTTGWGAQLIQTALGNFLSSLSPLSAAASVMARGPSVDDVSGMSAISFPARSGVPSTPHWVTEGNPIPVQSGTLSAVTLGPARKLGSIVVMTRELLNRSNAAAIFNTLLREDASKGLDAAVFSSEDGLGDAHAGLLNGATAVPGSGDVLKDMQNLAAAVSLGGSGQVVFVSGPAFAAAVGIDANIKATVFPSLAVAESRLVAVDPLSVVWGAGADPDIDVSAETVLHMSDEPEQISTPGSPATVAAPARSLFQTDSIATRMVLPICFSKRRAAAVAYTDNMNTVW